MIKYHLNVSRNNLIYALNMEPKCLSSSQYLIIKKLHITQKIFKISIGKVITIYLEVYGLFIDDINCHLNWVIDMLLPPFWIA